MAEYFTHYWPWITSFTLLAADIWATAHAVLQKRDHRAVVGWVGLVWLVPLAGVVLYFLFGINRIQRRAKRLIRKRRRSPSADSPPPDHEPLVGGMLEMARLNGRVTGRGISFGNRVQPYFTGEAAYSGMLTAIAEAKHSIGLATYIFDNDHTGKLFVTALSEAVKRGVEVRVLVDDIGSRYSFPSVVGKLRRAGVRCAVPTFDRPVAFRVRATAESSQVARHRWGRGLHRRHEHPRGARPADESAHADSRLPCPRRRAGGGRPARSVHRRLGICDSRAIERGEVESVARTGRFRRRPRHPQRAR